MIDEICSNCKHGMMLNSFYEGIDGELYPCKSYMMYCIEHDDYVGEDHNCKKWESCIKTIKIPYK